MGDGTQLTSIREWWAPNAGLRRAGEDSPYAMMETLNPSSTLTTRADTSSNT